jgi:hypothetical protein
VHGSFDPLALLAWLTLLAPALGALCARVAWAAGVPLVWSGLLFLTSTRANHALATPLWPACSVSGFFLIGLALGRWTRSPSNTAVWLILTSFFFSGVSLGFGLVPLGGELARTHPTLARWLLESSPLVLAFDCAGVDWVHRQPDVYVQAGIEWLARHPYRGSLAGPLVLVVGCALSGLARPDKPAR